MMLPTNPPRLACVLQLVEKCFSALSRWNELELAINTSAFVYLHLEDSYYSNFGKAVLKSLTGKTWMLTGQTFCLTHSSEPVHFFSPSCAR